MATSDQHRLPVKIPDAVDNAVRQCVHCGLCLASCPTYRELGTEMDSPRGRIYLVRGLIEGRLPTDSPDTHARATEHLDLCLGCRACETACPSGVHYGEILEGVRAAFYPATTAKQPWWKRQMANFLLHQLVPNRLGLGAIALSLRLYTGSGMRTAVEKSGVLKLFPAVHRDLMQKAPIPVGKPFHRNSATLYGAIGERRARVIFFTGCVMDAIMGDIHRDTIHVLTQQGVDVIVPKAQTCCGALHAHAGDHDFAVRLARENVRIMTQVDCDAIVNNSAGCGAHIGTWGHILRTTDSADDAHQVARKSIDISRFLIDLELRRLPGQLQGKVAYDAPCHLVHAQREAHAPLQLLRAIPGLDVIELPNSDHCCGAAGTYSVTQPDMSARVFANKADAVRAVQPDIVATGNPGCIMQFQQGLKAAGLAMRVAHPIELVAESYRTASN